MLPPDFKPSLPLSDDQATLLRGYAATGETIYLHLLGDRLQEDGYPIHGELLLRGVERGEYSAHGTSRRRETIELLLATRYVSHSAEHRIRVHCVRLFLFSTAFAVTVDVPATGSEIADLIEATQRVKPRSVLAAELAGLRSGEVKTWIDYLPAEAVN